MTGGQEGMLIDAMTQLLVIYQLLLIAASPPTPPLLF
jgi:hypothetical protein